MSSIYINFSRNLEGYRADKKMEKKNLIKSGVAVACLVVVSMFGFTVAFGYGGSSSGTIVTPACSSVTYSDWQTCTAGVQYRNILNQTPINCILTVSQQAGRSQSCTVTTPVTSGAGQVLGEKKYADGTLLRGSNGRTYIVVNGKLKYISSLAELAKYAGKEVISADSSVINAFQMVGVLGVKQHGEGSLIRGTDMKVWVIINGKRHHIVNLQELMHYVGQEIFNVSNDVVAGVQNEQ